MKKRIQKLLTLMIAVTIIVTSFNWNCVTSNATEIKEISYSFQVNHPLYYGSVTTTSIDDSMSYTMPVYSATEYMTSITQAGNYVREKMVNRISKISVRVRVDYSYIQAAKDILEAAYAETGYENEGDYLANQIDSYTCKVTGQIYKTRNKTYYYVQLAYNIKYFTTKKQEQEVSSKIEQIFKEFDFNNATPTYIKVKTIYDYICMNVEYDDNYDTNDNVLCYSAYGALINGKAVCQGYACLLYRMLRHAGVECRYIGSTQLGHAWNIIRIGNWYYNVDITWDSDLSDTKVSHKYFLKGSANFGDHVPVNAKYSMTEFRKNYPIRVSDYVYNKDKPEIDNIPAPERKNVEYKTVMWPACSVKAKIKSARNISGRKIRICIRKAAQADGYQIKYSINKGFKNSKIKGTTKRFVSLKKLKKKTYYIKVRGYTIINGKRYYGQWSPIIKIRVKK